MALLRYKGGNLLLARRPPPTTAAHLPSPTHHVAHPPPHNPLAFPYKPIAILEPTIYLLQLSPQADLQAYLAERRRFEGRWFESMRRLARIPDVAPKDEYQDQAPPHEGDTAILHWH